VRPLTLLLVLSACCLLAQTKPADKQPSRAEKQWCPVVESALAGSADLPPAMRALTLDMIAGGLKKCDPAAVHKALVDAFNATLAIPESQEDIAQQMRAHKEFDQSMRASLANLDAKQRLQTDVMTDLLAEDEAEVESLLPQAEPSVRDDLLSQMLSRAITAKKLDRALALLRQASPGRFPYSAATSLVLQLPPARDTDRQEIFRLAMAADRDHHSMVIGGDDFASMIVRFWKHLAPAVVQEAIQQVLDGARSKKSQIALGEGATKASFSNEYEFRVFELVPVLRELDPEEADKLLRDSAAVQAQVKQFPNGLQSLDPAVRDTPPKKGEHSRMSGMVGQNIGPMMLQSNTAEAYDSRVAEIVRLAENNPTQAIEAALALPNSAGPLAPRAQALLGIAGAIAAKNPSAARDALDRMAESLKSVEPTGQIGTRDYWAEGIEVAAKIDEMDLAKKLLKGGIADMEKLKGQDTNSDDPNLALKAWWPSTAALLRLMVAASHISSRVALEAIAEISDPELRVLCKANLANRQLGVHKGRSMVMRATRSSNWSEFGMED